nr:hypothetical protein [Pseudonocardia oroxyli]
MKREIKVTVGVGDRAIQESLDDANAVDDCVLVAMEKSRRGRRAAALAQEDPQCLA